MTIRITCLQPGLRRAGRRHPAGPLEYPDDAFSAAEMAALIAEPLLHVERIGEQTDRGAPHSTPSDDGSTEARGLPQPAQDGPGGNEGGGPATSARARRSRSKGG